jgi:hypothetical protein
MQEYILHNTQVSIQDNIQLSIADHSVQVMQEYILLNMKDSLQDPSQDNLKEVGLYFLVVYDMYLVQPGDM